MKLTLEQAEDFVKNNSEFFWDNYTINKFNPDPAAEYDRLGRRYSDQWGYVTSYEVDHKGEWTIS